MTQDADYGRTWKTYRRADGDLIAGEYSFMTEPDIFEEDSGEYTEVVEETWQLIGVRILKYGPTDVWCCKCDEDVALTEPTAEPVYCNACRPLLIDGPDLESAVWGDGPVEGRDYEQFDGVEP